MEGVSTSRHRYSFAGGGGGGAGLKRQATLVFMRILSEHSQ